MIKKFSAIAWMLLLLSTLMLTESCRTDNQNQTASTEQVGTRPDKVVTRLRGNPDALSPYRSISAVSRNVFRQIFPTLVNYDPKTTKLAPVLAKSLPSIEPITSGKWKGGEAYTYEIHDEAVWDNGTPVQASDYIFTLKIIFNPKIGGITGAYRGILEFIADVEVDPDNPRKFTVLTKRTYLDAIAATGAWIYPEYAYDPKGLLKDFSLADMSDPEKAGALADDPRLQEFADAFQSAQYNQDKDFIVSCGPYALEEWIPSQQLRLKRKKDWWGDELMEKYPLLSAYPEELVYKIVPDQNAAIAMAKEGSLDVLAAIPPTSFLEMIETDLIKDQYNIFTPPTFLYNYLGLNGVSPKLKDKEVRQALAHLLDVSVIIDEIYPGGLGEPISGPMGFYDYQDPKLTPYPYDVEKAKQLLDQSGWKDTDGNGIRDKVVDGQKQELDLEYSITPGNPVATNVSLTLQEGAKKAGININIVTKEFNLIRQSFRSKKFELFSSAHSLEPSLYDPYQFWHTASPGNYFSFGNAESDQVIDELRKTTNPERRTELYHQIQGMLYEEQPMIFINTAKERILVNKKFKNVFGSQVKPGVFPNYFQY